MNEPDEKEVVRRTREWIESMVIGLNLCPFARRPYEAGLIRYRVSDAATPEALRADLARELGELSRLSAGEVETTLLIHPAVLLDFIDYNDFLSVADEVLEELGLVGIIQIASFHPGYRFANTRPDAVENYTNRSPYPMLHLLREQSITRVAQRPDELLEIPKRNVETLRRLGVEGIKKRCPSTPVNRK